jgi:hypothetical protein
VFITERLFRFTVTWQNSTCRKIAGSIPDEVIVFFNLFNPSSRTTAPDSTQLLTQMSTRNLLEGKGRQTRKADNYAAICEPHRVTTLWASTACYRERLTFYHHYNAIWSEEKFLAVILFNCLSVEEAMECPICKFGNVRTVRLLFSFVEYGKTERVRWS